MQFDRGFRSPHFITDPEKQRVVPEDSYVLIHDRTSSLIRACISLMEKISQEGRPSLVIAEDVNGEALAALVVNAVRGTLEP